MTAKRLKDYIIPGLRKKWAPSYKKGFQRVTRWEWSDEIEFSPQAFTVFVTDWREGSAIVEQLLVEKADIVMQTGRAIQFNPASVI